MDYLKIYVLIGGIFFIGTWIYDAHMDEKQLKLNNYFKNYLWFSACFIAIFWPIVLIALIGEIELWNFAPKQTNPLEQKENTWNKKKKN